MSCLEADAGVTSASPSSSAEAAQSPHQSVSVPPALRQHTVTFSSSSSGDTASATDTPLEITLHLSIRCFTDYILLFVTEDATCAPGVVLRYDAPAVGPGAFLYEGETPSLDLTVLLGMRDHPLTNLLASSIAHRIRRYGESRPLLMGLSVVQAGRQLTNGPVKKAFLSFVTTEVLELAGQPQRTE